MSKDAEVLANPTYTQITHCRACDSSSWETVLDLGTHFICAFVDSRNDQLPSAPLELIRCHGCGLIQLKHSVHPDLLWFDYWYRSGINQTMRNALHGVVSEGVHWKGDGTWLDIGANDGTLLSKVPDTFTKIACEPARTFTAALEEHADIVIADFFEGQDQCVGRCDVITSCAMWYDLDNPREFCKQINRCLGEGGVWINQLTSTDSMLATNDIGNVCHEHRMYPDMAVIQNVYAEAGLVLVGHSTNDTNGGSIRLTAMRKSEARISVPPIPGIEPPAWHQFSERVKRWKTRMLELFDSPSVRSGSIFGYGASTKGSTLLQYLGISDRLLAIADRNPLKHGKVMAGVWVPIVDEHRLRRHQPEHLLVLPWAFEREFIERERDYLNNGGTMIFPLPQIKLVQ